MFPGFISAGFRLMNSLIENYYHSIITIDEITSQSNLIKSMFVSLRETISLNSTGRIGEKESVEDAGMSLMYNLLSLSCPTATVSPLQLIIDNDPISLMVSLAKTGNVTGLKTLFIDYTNVFITILNANNKLLEEHILTNPGESTDVVMHAAFAVMHDNVDSPQIVCAALDLINSLFSAAQSPHLRIQLLTYVLFNSELGFLVHPLMKAHFSSSSTMFKLLQTVYNVFSATDVPPLTLCEASIQERVVTAVASVMKEYPTNLGLQTKAMRTLQRVLDAAIVNGESIEIPLDKETYQILSASLENFVNNSEIYGNYIVVLAKFSRLGNTNRFLLQRESFVKKIINTVQVFPDNTFIASCCCEALVELSKDTIFYNDDQSRGRSGHGGGNGDGLSTSGNLGISGTPRNSSIVDIVVTIIRINKNNPVILAPAFASLCSISTNSKDLLDAVAREDMVPIASTLLKSFGEDTDIVKSAVSFIDIIAKSKKDVAKSLCSDSDFVNALLKTMKESSTGPIAIHGCGILSSICTASGNSSAWGEDPAVTVCALILAAAEGVTPDVPSMRAGFSALASLASTDKDGFTAKVLSKEGRIEKLISLIAKNSAAASLVDASFAAIAEIAGANKENRDVIGQCGGIHIIVNSIADKGYVGNVSANGCYALSRLASSDDGPSANRDIIGKEGGISAIVSSMMGYGGDQNVQKYGCMALGNIGFKHAENARHITKMGGTTAIFVTMQNNPTNTTIQSEACRALGRIADGNTEAAEAIGDDGVDTVIRTLRTSAGSTALQAASLYALYSLLSASEAIRSRIISTRLEVPDIVASVGKASPQDNEVQDRVCETLSLISKFNEEKRKQEQQMSEQQQQQQQPQQPQQPQMQQELDLGQPQIQQMQDPMQMQQMQDPMQMQDPNQIQPEAEVTSPRMHQLQRMPSQMTMMQMPIHTSSMLNMNMGGNMMNMGGGQEVSSLDMLLESIKMNSSNPPLLKSSLKRMHAALKQMKVQNNSTVQDVFVTKGGVKLIVHIIIANNNSTSIKTLSFSILSTLGDNDVVASEIVNVLLGTNMVVPLLCENMNPAIVTEPILHRAVCIIVGSLARFRPWLEVLEMAEAITASVVRVLTSYITTFPVVKSCLQVLSRLTTMSPKLARTIVNSGGISGALSVLSSLAPITPSADHISTNIEECVVIFLGNICVKESSAMQTFIDANGVASIIGLVQKYFSAYADPNFLSLIKGLLYIIAVLASKTYENIRIAFYESGVVMPLIFGSFNTAIADMHPEKTMQPLVKSASIAFANMIISRTVLDSINPTEVPLVLVSLLAKQTSTQVISELIRAISKMAVSKDLADGLYKCNAINVISESIKNNSSSSSVIQYGSLALGNIISNCSKDGFDYDDEDENEDDDDDDSDSDSDNENETQPEEDKTADAAVNATNANDAPLLLGEELIKLFLKVMKESKVPMVVDNILLALSRVFLYSKKDRAIMEHIENFTKTIFDKIMLYPRNEVLNRSCFESLESFCSIKDNARFRTEFLTLGGVKYLLSQLTAFQGHPNVCEAGLKLLDALTGKRSGEWGERSNEDVAARFLYNERGLAVITTLIKVYSQQLNIQLYCCSLLEKIEIVVGDSLQQDSQENLLDLVILAMKTHYLCTTMQQLGSLFMARIAGYNSLCAQIIRRGALTVIIDALQRHKNKAVQVSGIKALAAIASSSQRDPSCSALMLTHIDNAIKAVVNAMRMCPQQAAIQEVACLFLGNIMATNTRSASTFLNDKDLSVLTAALENFTAGHRKPALLKNACFALAALAKGVPDSLRSAVASVMTANNGQNTIGRLILGAMSACQGFELLQRYAIVALGVVIPGTADTETEQFAVHTIIHSLSVFGRISAPLFCEACLALSTLVDGSRSNGTLFVRSGGLDLILPRLTDNSPAVTLNVVRLLTPLYSLASAGLLDPSDARIAQSFPTLMAVLAGAPNGPIKKKVFKCITKCFAAAPLVPELLSDLVCNVLPACPDPADVPAMEFWKITIVALVFLTSENERNCTTIVTSNEAVKSICDTVAVLYSPPPAGFAPPPADALERLAILVGNICMFGYPSIRSNSFVLNAFSSLKGLVVEVHQRMGLNDDIMNYARDKISMLTI